MLSPPGLSPESFGTQPLGAAGSSKSSLPDFPNAGVPELWMESLLALACTGLIFYLVIDPLVKIALRGSRNSTAGGGRSSNNPQPLKRFSV